MKLIQNFENFWSSEEEKNVKRLIFSLRITKFNCFMYQKLLDFFTGYVRLGILE